MSIATDSGFDIAPPRPILVQLACAASCVALADWLFYGWAVGISLALFFAVVGLLSLVSNRLQASLRVQLAMSLLFVAGLVALIEEVNPLSAILGVLATGLFVIVLTDKGTQSWQRRLLQAGLAPVLGPFQLFVDLLGGFSYVRSGNAGWPTANSLVAWIVPVSAFGLFLYLFGSANPLIESALAGIDLRALNVVDPGRVAFWLAAAGGIWSLVAQREKRQREPLPEESFRVVSIPFDWDFLFSAQAVARTLILVNMLFAVQTGLDLVYLWGGVKLPSGMSYAGYAHRGAYPLMVTAVLAGVFVLIAMRRNGPAEKSVLIKPLVLVWIAQNILLVISAILRLDLYVAAFSLTELRLTAFIWMGLVTASLSLMLVQILMKKSNAWLLASNAAAVALVIYGHCFIDYPRLIASYNVEHCREAGGTGPTLDTRYLLMLGPHALPALQAHMGQIPSLRPIVVTLRARQEEDEGLRLSNWRTWGFREWRLAQYLANNPVPLVNSAGGAGQVQQ